MKIIRFCLFCCLTFGFMTAASAQSGSICGDPSQKECVGQYDGFEAQDLIFNTGRAALGTGTRHESVEFYAVILESVLAAKPNGGCNFISETKRKAAQKLFPNNKVFASRQSCRGNVVLYENTSDEYNFMAIYAGESETQAARILAKARKKYPSANIRKMKIILDFGDE